ncbi:hypothetical protein K431DRAFT_344631 [Polychaeton citri CBS 116435]|uniref:Uncharacterized protein n=1 Tax=Polychaeton citri CBS 116435 TaxID=1314669 RepID=A0A9P4QEJ3_9PEZI|nr:hypothetical protein K431DRAFT_344631 [Polychaeton citri CBS 116435]
MAKPARRATVFRPFEEKSKHERSIKGDWHGLREMNYSRSQVSLLSQDQSACASPPVSQRKEGRLRSLNLDTDPRRRTIFVPSDETTIMTARPKTKADSRINDTFQLFSPEKFPGLSASTENRKVEFASERRAAQPRLLRMSLANGPKRFPLQKKTTVPSNLITVDIAGHDTGKENEPPGFIKSSEGELQRSANVQQAAMKSVHKPSAAMLNMQRAAPSARQSAALSKATKVAGADGQSPVCFYDQQARVLGQNRHRQATQKERSMVCRWSHVSHTSSVVSSPKIAAQRS